MRFLRKLNALRRRRKLDQDLEEELQFHLDMKAADTGAPSRRQFGNPTQFKEVLREMWTFPQLESWWSDIRYACRSLAASPGFTAVAVAALALGIGADTAIFTIIKGAFTWDLGLDHTDRFVLITRTNSSEHGTEWTNSYPDFLDLRAQAKSFAGIAAYRYVPSNLSDSKALPERIWRAQMSSNGFEVAEYKPFLGRGFVDADDAPNATPIVVLSHHLWQKRYGADPNILNQVIRVNEVPRVVVGVMPPDRRHPEDAEMWTPLGASERNDLGMERREQRDLMVFARLQEHANMAQARAELETIGSRLAAQFPGTNKNLSLGLRPIADATPLNQLRPLFAILFAAVGFVLLIACADVANMLLARGTGRVREMAIRLAIGAGRARILRQLLIESVVLSLCGGLVGWLVALGGLKWFETGIAFDKPVWLQLSIDRSAFAYLAGISVAAGIVSGFAPAWRLMAGSGVGGLLKDGGHGSVGGRATSRLATSLVVFQMVLCVILLSGAGLMMRSASKLYTAPIGVPEPANVLTARLVLPMAKYPKPADRIEFHRVAKELIESMPGVTLEALTSNPPLGGWLTQEIQLQSESETRRLDSIIATPSYFPLFDLKPLAGKLASNDIEVVVNQSFAAKYWPNESGVGKSLRTIKDHVPQPWLTVTGVIPDVLQNVRDQLERHPLVYLPYNVVPDAEYVLLRTRVPASTLANPLRAEIQRLDPNLALSPVTLQDRLDSAHSEVSIFGAICSVFAVIALVLATIGLYSVVAHSVSMRNQEIGLRMAIGGTRGDIIRLIFTQGMRPLLIGLCIGIPLAMAAMTGMRGALIGVTSTDPLTFASTVLILLAAGALGCIVPVRRATKVDPVVALRCQ